MERGYREAAAPPPGSRNERTRNERKYRGSNYRPHDPPSTSWPENRYHDRDTDRNRDYDREYDRDRAHYGQDRSRDHYESTDRNNRDSRGQYNSYRPTDPPRHQDGHGQPAFQFGGSGSYRPPRGDFDFQSTMPASVQREIDRLDTGDAPRPNPSARARNRDGYRGGYQGRRPKSVFRRRIAAERDLLTGDHASGPSESLVNADSGFTYRNPDELSDSEEVEMDISDGSDSDSSQPPQKRARVNLPEPPTIEKKWTNPDPYTALPCDGARAIKRKDPVQLIRKARVQSKEAKTSIPLEAADFIPIDGDSDDELDFSAVKPTQNSGPPGGQQTTTLPSPRAAYGDNSLDRPPVFKRLSPLPDRPPVSDDIPAFLPPKYETLHIGHSLPPKPPPVKDQNVLNMVKPQDILDMATAPAVKDQNGIDLTKPRQDLVPGPFPAPFYRGQGADETELPGESRTRRRDANLGNRKRTHDDQIKGPSPFQQKKVGGPAPKGNLAPEWAPTRGLDATPWFTCRRTQSLNPATWLHEEIVDFYNYVRPRSFEEKIRKGLHDRLSEFVRRKFKDADVYPFGSYPSGLYLPTGDMDMAFLSDQYKNGGPGLYNSAQAHRKLRKDLQNARMAYHGEIEYISKAKVPLIKYVDAKSALKVDISFENDSGVVAINTFKRWKEQYEAMPVLVTLIKQFLAMRGLNEPFNGGIGGFSVICLVVSMLQMHPDVQAGALDTKHDMGNLLLDFFDLYGNRFNWEGIAISLDPPQYIPKQSVKAFPYRQYDRLSIIDPNNPSNDIAGGSSNIRTIVKEFSKAHTALINRMSQIDGHPNSKDMSILSVILGGNYSSFESQRNHMERLSQIITSGQN